MMNQWFPLRVVFDSTYSTSLMNVWVTRATSSGASWRDKLNGDGCWFWPLVSPIHPQQFGIEYQWSVHLAGDFVLANPFRGCFVESGRLRQTVRARGHCWYKAAATAKFDRVAVAYDVPIYEFIVGPYPQRNVTSLALHTSNAFV